MTLSKKQGVLVALAIAAIFVIAVFSIVLGLSGWPSPTGVTIKACQPSASNTIVMVTMTNLGQFLGLGGSDFDPSTIHFYQNGTEVSYNFIYPVGTKVQPGQMDTEVFFSFGRGAPDTLQYNYGGVTKTVTIGGPYSSPCVK